MLRVSLVKTVETIWMLWEIKSLHLNLARIREERSASLQWTILLHICKDGDFVGASGQFQLLFPWGPIPLQLWWRRNPRGLQLTTDAYFCIPGRISSIFDEVSDDGVLSTNIYGDSYICVFVPWCGCVCVVGIRWPGVHIWRSILTPITSSYSPCRGYCSHVLIFGKSHRAHVFALRGVWLTSGSVPSPYIPAI